MRNLSLLALFALLSGCAGLHKPVNQPITQVDESSGYRRIVLDRGALMSENMVLLAFSGGGTRAAALSYGVMQELRDTYIQRGGEEVRLLDEVDNISGVSGGSFTAAYYGLFREKLFEDYESVFLRQDVQSTLIRKMFSPGYWFNSAFSGFDRTEMAIDYYDRNIFKGGTFADIAANGPPYIDINATDLTTGMRFTFGQELFDLLCSDLSSIKVARAVTASSAVPVAFPSVVLKNHSDKCDISGTREWEILTKAEIESEVQGKLVEDLKSYRNTQQRKYIHLVDGGISDNLGLRAMIDRLEGLGEERFQLLSEYGVKNLLVILVNAAVHRESLIEQSPKKPGAATTMGAYINSQMRRYDQETLDRTRENVRFYQAKAEREGLPLQLYFTEVTFDHVPNTEAESILNNMPTTLELSDREVDQLIASGRLLLRTEPSFQRFKEKNNGRLAAGAMDDKDLCDLFEVANCPLDRPATAPPN